jgi:hypothetical protein
MPVRFEDKLSIQAGTDASHAITKQQLDAAVADAKNRATHSGSQASTTISDFEAAVQAVITAYLEIGASPATLNTLNELAAALGDDPNFATTLAGQIAGLDGRLDDLEGSPTSGRTHSALVGNGVASSFPVAHNWALADKNKVTAEIVDTGTGETVYASVVRTDTNTVTVSFGSAVPTSNQYRVLLVEIL